MFCPNSHDLTKVIIELECRGRKWPNSMARVTLSGEVYDRPYYLIVVPHRDMRNLIMVSCRSQKIWRPREEKMSYAEISGTICTQQQCAIFLKALYLSSTLFVFWIFQWNKNMRLFSIIMNQFIIFNGSKHYESAETCLCLLNLLFGVAFD